MINQLKSMYFALGRWYCFFFGHNFYQSKKVTHHVKEYCCKRCQKQATTNSNGELEMMTPVRKEINEMLAFVHAKKLARKNKKKPEYQVAS